MAQFIFLNEKSYGSAQTSPEAAQQALAAFSEAMVGVKRLLPNLSLLSSDRIGRLQLANGYSMSQWLNSGSEHREKARFLLTLANHAPFDTVVGLLHDADPGVTCYRCLGEPVEGIGLACLYGGMPVSLPIDEQWKTNTLSVDAEQILEDNSQSAWSTNVRHASLLQHVEDHRAWIVSLRRRDIANALDFSTRRLELFPFLAFTASTLKDIDKLEKPAFYQVMQIGRAHV